MDISEYSVAVEGGWKWEYSANDIHQVDDAEHIRDHLLRAIYSAFSKAKQQEEHAKRELSWVGYIAGKRESRRLMGDYIYTMKDMTNGTLFDDAVVQETRSIDLHFQKCIEGLPDDFRSWALFRKVPSYYVPFRCLYSKNVDNLMMAGRCFSCSHVGLGGPRVMKTCGQMGIATGYAASLCIQHRTTPRGVYQNHIDELKKLIGPRVVKERGRAPITIQPAGEARRTSDPERRENAISKLPDELNALKSVAAPRYSFRQPGTGFTFRISAPAVVYISVHQRGGYTPPASWKKADMKLTWFPKWHKRPQKYTDVVYMKKFDAGVVEIPVHDGGDPSYGLPHLAFVEGANVTISEADDTD